MKLLSNVWVVGWSSGNGALGSLIALSTFGWSRSTADGHWPFAGFSTGLMQTYGSTEGCPEGKGVLAAIYWSIFLQNAKIKRKNEQELPSDGRKLATGKMHCVPMTSWHVRSKFCLHQRVV